MHERSHRRWKGPQKAGIGEPAGSVVEPAMGPPIVLAVGRKVEIDGAIR